MTETLLSPTSLEGNTITIEGKQFGRGRALFPTYQIPLPAHPLSLRDFLALVVRNEVASFAERQEQRRMLQVLTAEQIAEGATAGKIDSGGRTEATVEVDVEQATASAIQAFSDGLYFVFIDDTQQEDLEGSVSLKDGSRVMFLRLVPLAGG